MKRYLALIGITLFTLFVTISLFVLLISQDNSFITYIKIQVNPSFVMGINDKDNVVFYNALNEDANKYNLEMFQGKSLTEATQIFIEKFGTSYPGKDEINITVMTKDDEKEKRITDIIANVVRSYDDTYIIINHEPTFDELERYSNETIHNIDASFKNTELKQVGALIYQKVENYLEDRFTSLELDTLSDEEKIDLIKEKQQEGYFNDLVINNFDLQMDDTKLLERTAYTIEITFNDDYTYEYKIILNLEVEHFKYELKKIVEVYQYDYEVGEDIEIINNLKKYFYTF